MAAYSSRKSVFGVAVESTAGTPVDIASGSDIITVHEGFSMDSDRGEIQNLELSASVDAKAPIAGREEPKADGANYLRHSGTEATAPNYDTLIKAALGDKTAAFSEKTLTSSSTAGTSAAAAVLKLASGGSSYERGHAVLVKDSTNGYSIRNVLSISTNDLTLGFNLAAAPASGVTVGRPILYKPSDTPPSLTLFQWIANGAAIETISGAVVSEMSVECTAGDTLTAKYGFEGIGYYFDSIRISATDIYIDFNDGGVKAAVITAKLYKHPHELAAAIQTAMNVVSSGFTVVYNNIGASAGKFTFTKASGTFSLLFATGANLANSIADKIGFAATDLSAALTYTSDTVLSWVAPYTATPDANVNPIIVKNNEVMIGTFDRYSCAGARSFSMSISNTYENVDDVCAETGVASKLLSKREVTVEAKLTLAKHDVDAFNKYISSDTVSFCYNGGVKVGGNWVAGRCVNIYLPQCKIVNHKVGEENGQVILDLTLSTFGAGDTLGTTYMNFI